MPTREALQRVRKWLAKQYRLSREAEEKVAKKFGGILPMPAIGKIRETFKTARELARVRELARRGIEEFIKETPKKRLLKMVITRKLGTYPTKKWKKISVEKVLRALEKVHKRIGEYPR